MGIQTRQWAGLGWWGLALALGALSVIQLWAGLALRGLYADGAYYAAQLLLRQSFIIIEPSRFTSQVLLQAPVVLAMRLGFDHPPAVALAFSLATNLMPLTLSLISVWVLPKAERAYGLFPIFVFLSASMSAAFASVADGPTAAAYAWLLLLLLLFGPLTWPRLAAILALSLGALRLHEAMAFLAPILAFACLWRCRETPAGWARGILLLSALLIVLGGAIAVRDVLHPRMIANRASFFRDLADFGWLATGPVVSMAALAGCLAVLALPLAFFGGRAWRVGMAGLALLFLAVAVAAILEPAAPASAFAARNNACLLTAPAMILLLALRLRPMALPHPATPALLCALLALATATADAAATIGWTRYTGAMRQVLASGQGVIAWDSALASLPAPEADRFRRYAWPWTTPLMSLWLAPDPATTPLIANPPGIVWQPFDPYAQRGQRAETGALSGRGRFIALLRP